MMPFPFCGKGYVPSAIWGPSPRWKGCRAGLWVLYQAVPAFDWQALLSLSDECVHKGPAPRASSAGPPHGECPAVVTDTAALLGSRAVAPTWGLAGVVTGPIAH